VKPAAQRKAVEHVRQLFAISERRACSILAVDRMSIRTRHMVELQVPVSRRGPASGNELAFPSLA
jgi:hypothetical protein